MSPGPCKAAGIRHADTVSQLMCPIPRGQPDRRPALLERQIAFLYIEIIDYPASWGNSQLSVYDQLLTAHSHHVTGHQLAAAPGLDLAVDLDAAGT